MVNVKFLSLIFAIVILVCGVGSASFAIGNASHSLQTNYAAKGIISGWMNISLTDENANSIVSTFFGSGFGGSSYLLGLLQGAGADFSCTPLDCESDYSTQDSGGTNKTFSLNADKSKIIGLKLTGDVTLVNSVKFSAESDATSSCVNQLKIDILNDGEVEIGNNKSVGGVCGDKNYNCFDSEKGTEKYSLSADVRCQKIKLPEAPGFELGAWVQKSSGSASLKMEIYNLDENKVAECNLPAASDSGGEISCDVEYHLLESGEHYVCISADGSGTYYTRGNNDMQTIEPCGFESFPFEMESLISAYQIYAKPKKFDAVGTLEIKDNLPTEEYFGELVDEYVDAKYSKDCSSGCIVPIKFSAGKSQSITVSGLEINYDRASGGGIIEENFYDLEEQPAKINSGFQEITLDNAGFAVPDGVGNITLTMKLKEDEIFSQEISVGDVPSVVALTPTSTYAGLPTKFTANLSSGASVSKYEWDFGDGTNITTTTTNYVYHTYKTISNFALKVTIRVGDLTSTRSYAITVASPKSILNATLTQKTSDLAKAKTDIAAFSTFIQGKLNKIVNLTSTETQLNSIKQDYASASTDADYIKVMKDLAGLEIPKSVFVSEQAEGVPFYPKKEHIDLDVLKEIGGGNYDSSKTSAYKDAIIAHEYADVDFDYVQISVDYGYGTSEYVSTFNMDADFENSKDYYIIFKDLGFEFQGDSPETENGYVYIETSEDKVIQFSILKKVDFTDLPVFISPGVNALSVSSSGGGSEVCNYDGECDEGENWKNCRDCSGAMTISIVIFLILAVGVVLYIIMRKWYKNKYEGHLFKNPTDLNNLMSFISGAKEKGMHHKEVSSKLKESGWKGEQIKFALKKHSKTKKK